MKKFKIVLAAVLACVLCLLCITGNTFSWFSRPKELEGNQLDFSETYSSSVKENITFATYESSDGVTYGTTPVTNFSESSGVDSGARKYYRTDIINTGANAQSVSLYLKSLTFGSNADGLALGVNGPSKNYRTFTTQANGEVVSTNKMRVYFQPDNKTNWTGGAYNVCYGVTNDPSHYVELKLTPKSGTYYADIPSNAKKLFFAVKDWKESWQRTQTFTDIVSDGQTPLSSRVFKINGSYDNTYNNAQADKYAVDGANIAYYYQTINLTTNSSFNAGLVVNEHYIADSITYTSSNTSVFTVDSNGVITGVGKGTATLTVNVKGESFNDTDKVETEVVVTDSVNSVSDVPVVTNVKVLPSVLDSDGTTHIPSVSVYWYIKNDSGKDDMTYTIPEVYLTL